MQVKLLLFYTTCNLTSHLINISFVVIISVYIPWQFCVFLFPFSVLIILVDLVFLNDLKIMSEVLVTTPLAPFRCHFCIFSIQVRDRRLILVLLYSSKNINKAIVYKYRTFLSDMWSVLSLEFCFHTGGWVISCPELLIIIAFTDVFPSVRMHFTILIFLENNIRLAFRDWPLLFFEASIIENCILIHFQMKRVCIPSTGRWVDLQKFLAFLERF